MTDFRARLPSMARRFVLLLGLSSLCGGALAEGEVGLLHAGSDIDDIASMQRGAKLFMNYCSGCHSLKYLRYSRMQQDLDLSEDEVMGNLNFTGGKIGDSPQVALTEDEAKQFFGKMPPDLSLIARVRGTDWIYTYLKSFYLDDTRPVGWNNTLFPNASMPNPLSELQGLQVPEYSKPDSAGDRPVEKLNLLRPGTQNAAQFDQSVRDITTFLEYAGEPAAIKRQGMGAWVVLFLALFSFLAWLLKKEFWKDVH